MLQFSLKSTRMVQKSELIYDLSWFLFLMLYPWSNTSRRCIFFVRCMWHFSIASLHVILHSGFCGISCVMLRFVLSPFFGLVMRAVLSVRRLGVLSLFALRHSVPSFLIVVRVRGHAGMWNACDCWAYWCVFWFRRLWRADFDTRRLLFLCCVCNIIFDDGAVILGFICAVYFIESIRQELIERLLISFFGEIWCCCGLCTSGVVSL